MGKGDRSVARDARVTHLCVDTMRIGLTKPDQHVEMLRRFKEAALTP